LLKGLAIIAGLFAFGDGCQARVLEVGEGRAFGGVAAAAAALRDGDTMRIFPGRYDGCAVLRADGLTVEGAGDAASVVLAGGICQGKAILVAAGRGLTLRRLTLAEARVPAGNGAGLRAEGGGTVSVDEVRFIDDQNGILTAAVPDMVLIVRDSVFEHDGACVQACAHGIYAGHIARLSVSGSVFRDTQDGHAIKSRAARTEIAGCDIADGPEGTGSYLVEAPNGGIVQIQGNRLEKGARAGNRAAIAIGTEGAVQPGPAPRIEGNVFRNTSTRQMVFVRNDGAQPVAMRANTLTGGPIIPLTGTGTIQ
jgi:hypothetical protein